jgi:transglycosylase-like protein with SLT domain
VSPRARLVFLAAVTVALSGCEYLPRATDTAWLVVLGDATRRADGQPWEQVPPPSTQVIALPAPAPPEPICHAEHRHAVTVSEAIRHWFPEGWWATFCRIAWCESTFEPGAYNRSGATGLFQIMPFWHDEVDVDPWTIWGSTALARHVFDVQGPDAWTCY